MNEDEFFIGWQGKAPEKTGRFLRRHVVVTLLLAIGMATGVAALQKTIGRAYWEFFGDPQEFAGVLLAEPVPMLIGKQTGAAGDDKIYLLVNPNKYGFDSELAKSLHLKQISLHGTLLRRDDKFQGAMIEVVEGSAKASGDADQSNLLSAAELPKGSYVGEIVDGKCYLGAMNPGVLKTHRACAINCIRGGIPAFLLIRDGPAAGLHLLLGPTGESINEQILDRVAEAVVVNGVMESRGTLSVLRADPATIQPIVPES